MTTQPSIRPKIRPVQTQPMVRNGQAGLVLMDPLRLSGRVIFVPQALAPVLALADGTRDLNELRAALMIRAGVRVSPAVLETLFAQLDEALLLDNDRFAAARQAALEEYRAAPFRPPSMAGRSYPADPEELARLLQSYLDATLVSVSDEPADSVCGLISPHIDYQRGGAVYAGVWQAAAEAVRQAECVILFGTDHFGKDGTLTLTRQHYATPWGVLPTDQAVVDAVSAALGQEVAFGEEVNHRSEHSLELVVVWLHHMRGGQPCSLVPILCGGLEMYMEPGKPGPGEDARLTAAIEALRQAVIGRRTLVVAAADLAHLGPAFNTPPLDFAARARLRTQDGELLRVIATGDAEALFRLVAAEGNRRHICGLAPIYWMLRLLDGATGILTGYEHCPADQRGTSLVSIAGMVFRRK